MTVKERDTGSVRFAIGVGSNTGLIGDVTYQKENFDPFDLPEDCGDFFEAFTGGGQRLTLSAQPGTEVSRLYASYFNPRVNDSYWSFRQDAFLTYAIREAWREQKAGFATSVGRKITDDMIAGLTLRNEWVKVTDIQDDAPDIVNEFPGENLLVSLQLAVKYSKLDNFLDPSDGVNLGATFEHAGLWGEIGFNQVQADAEWYIPLCEDSDERKHVMRVKGTVGWAQEYGNSPNVPIYERFFEGGASSIRGFAYRGVGPMQFGNPTGGEAMWLANVEYGFPVFGVPTPGAPSLRGVLFADAGSLAEEWGDGELGRARLAVGFGVRVVVPFLGPRPVAVDFGFPIISYDGDEEQLLSFSFGSNFYRRRLLRRAASTTGGTSNEKPVDAAGGRARHSPSLRAQTPIGSSTSSAASRSTRRPRSSASSSRPSWTTGPGDPGGKAQGRGPKDQMDLYTAGSDEWLALAKKIGLGAAQIELDQQELQFKSARLAELIAKLYDDVRREMKNVAEAKGLKLVLMYVATDAQGLERHRGHEQHHGPPGHVLRSEQRHHGRGRSTASTSRCREAHRQGSRSERRGPDRRRPRRGDPRVRGDRAGGRGRHHVRLGRPLPRAAGEDEGVRGGAQGRVGRVPRGADHHSGPEPRVRPHRGRGRACHRARPRRRRSARRCVDPAAAVDPTATIRAGAVVSAGARVGARTIVGSGSFVGEDAVVGADCLLHPNVSSFTT